MKYLKSPSLQLVFVALLIAMALSSCEDLLTKELDFEDDFDFEEQLGLSGTLYNDFGGIDSSRITRILLAESQSVIEPEFVPKVYNDGEIFINRDGEYHGELIPSGESDGLYLNINQDTSEFLEFPVGEYEIQVNHPDYGLVSSKTTIPEPVYLTELSTDSLSISGSDFARTTPYLVTVTFTDPPGDNYYNFDIFTDNSNLELDTFIYGMDTFLIESYSYAYIESVNNTNVVETFDNGIFMRDELFDNSEFTLSFYINIFGDNFMDKTFEEILDPVKLRWSCISEEQYNFRTSYFNYINSQDFGPFSEPVSLYSNIENGLGYFGAENYYNVPLEE